MTDDITKELVAGQARMEQKLDDLHNRLFGNGQPGVIQFLAGEIKEVKDKQNDMDTLKWKLGTLSAGAGASLALFAQWVGSKLFR